jgi:hypothetical protein
VQERAFRAGGRPVCYIASVTRPPAAARLLSSVALLLVASSARAELLPAPAHLGDVSLGLGPALVLLQNGDVQPGVTGEANLLAGAFAFGAHGRVAFGDGAVHPLVGLEAAVLGMIGGGMSWRPGGVSVDGLLQVPLPLLPSPFYLAVAWRPMFLLHGGIEHEVAVQLKWSTLLLPDPE